MKRSTLIMSCALQAVLTVSAATLSIYLPPDAGTLIAEGNYDVLAPIFLLSLQAGGQCVLSRILGYGELPTVVLTSGYCDLAMDAELFSGFGANSKRNRRLLSIATIITGAAIGGHIDHVTTALWAVAGVKMVMCLAWVVWPGKKIELE